MIDVQRLPFNNEQTFTGQLAQDQQRTQVFNPELVADLPNGQLESKDLSI